MFQKFDNQTYYIVDLPTFPPPMPITDGGDTALTQYAEALTKAINDGLVTGPGKYAIMVSSSTGWYSILKIIE